jgi:hypothetical protein
MNINLTDRLNDESLPDLQVKWEWIKFKVRDETMKYARKKSLLRKDKIKELNTKLNLLEISLADTPSNITLDEIKVTKNELEELDAKIIDGIIVRSSFRWAEKREKSNKYFLGLEKRNCKWKQC